MAYPLVWTHFTPQDVAALQKRLRDEWQEIHHAAHHERVAGSCLLAGTCCGHGLLGPSDPEAKM